MSHYPLIRCPKCFSHELDLRGDPKHSNYTVYQCLKCGNDGSNIEFSVNNPEGCIAVNQGEDVKE